MAKDKMFLVKSLGGIKSRITLFRNKLEIEDSPSLSLGELTSMINRLHPLYDKFDDTLTELEYIDPNTSYEHEREQFEESYGYVDSTITERIGELNDRKMSAVLADKRNRSENDSSSISERSTVVTPNIPLPEMRLPEFDGNFLNWNDFKQIYTELIHNNVRISPVVKFQYLKSSLEKGSAFHIIKGVTASPLNYENVWKSLFEFFENEARLKYACMKELYYIKPIKKENDAVSLRIFIDNVWKQYNSLKALNIPVEGWDLYLVFHVSELLDPESRKEVELKKTANEIPTIKEILDTLSNRARILEAMSPVNKIKESKQCFPNKLPLSSNKSSHSLVSTEDSDNKNVTKCKYCNENHSIFQCNSFGSLTWVKKNEWVRASKVCRNCFGSHYVNKCSSKKGCKYCRQQHHTLLHIDFKNQQGSNIPKFSNSNQDSGAIPKVFANNNQISNLAYENACNSVASNQIQSNLNPIDQLSSKPQSSLLASNENSIVSSSLHATIHNILLFTAVVWVRDHSGNKIPCRVLLDSASHTNFITEELCQKLGTQKTESYVSIAGINQQMSQLKHMTKATVESRVSPYKTTLNFLVIPKITGELPLYPVQFNKHSISSLIKLGDPSFYKPSKIDMLIGAEVYDEIMLQNRIEISRELPPFRESMFGYVVCGRSNVVRTSAFVSLVCCSTDQLCRDIQKFWQIEEVNSPNNYSLSDKLCEDKYVNSVKRDSSGRYCVSLPFKSSPSNLGDSSKGALKQFYYMEQRLIKNPSLKNEYVAFMNEYESLNHMTKICPDEHSSKTQYFLPHHAVIRESSSTTKVRVVFNASAKTSSGLSLNEILLSGPTIQPDIFTMLCRFRMFKIALTADITKMYRQINIDPSHRNLQLIYWRKSHNLPISIYQLNTVTYGTASAPFLAIRTLKQLAFDESSNYPKAANILLNHFYVDDMITGSDNVKEIVEIRNELNSLLASGGFELQKWVSNDKSVVALDLNRKSDVVTILGIRWNHVNDSIMIRICDNKEFVKLTKRMILSTIATFYDPMGLSAPVILAVKMFLQKITMIPELKWDDDVPDNLLFEWNEFYKDLSLLQNIEVPRCALIGEQNKSIELHGFGDASERGYGCVIYIRTQDQNGEFQCQLLCSKSKVAPLKRQTIPRLELCSSLLLAQLYHKVVECLQIKFDRVVLWSDSEVTLYRIKSDPSKYPTFVANRISKIQDLTSPDCWDHVPTSLNPADLVSRGMLASQLQTCDLWWKGPTFLSTHPDEWPSSKFDSKSIKDPEQSLVTLQASQVPSQNIFVERYSNFNKIMRIAALCMRFIHNSRFQMIHKRTGRVSSEEINLALYAIIRSIQEQYFKLEITNLKKDSKVPKQSKIKKLNVFLDDKNLLRIGGRLENSELPWEQRHPVLVPNCRLARIIVENEHFRNLHAGPQALLSFVRQRFWLIDAKNICNGVFRKCIRCFRMRPTNVEQLMGQLPSNRVKPFRAFQNSGVDFCGPIFVVSKIRSNVIQKVYIALFVCFSTKAVHLEVVTDLSTPAFVAALRRFFCRRGKCANIYSDNATNFIGAKSELIELKRLFESELHKNELEKFFSEEGIVWHNIPPRSPHFGGLWEAAIKSAKHHLKRALGTHKCTLEELNTLVVQIEGILNSRPLTPMSSNIDDYTSLTPGHFLIGGPLNALPEPSVCHLDFNRLSRYQRLQFCMQKFWQRWSAEYLMELQCRQKWNIENSKIKIGNLVLLHEDNVPPMHWIMGRIVETHPGTDGLIRVVTVRTSSGLFKRAIARISILPVEVIDV